MPRLAAEALQDTADNAGIGPSAKGVGEYDAAGQLEQRRVELPNTEEIKGYVADFREMLPDATLLERKALIRNFVQGVGVTGDEATLTYTIPMPLDGATSEGASVLDFVQSGMGNWLWYFLTSAHGQAQLAKRLTVSATVTSLSARSLGEVEVPVPSPRELDLVARLVEASEAAYNSAVEAARLRRGALRDAVIHEIGRRDARVT